MAGSCFAKRTLLCQDIYLGEATLLTDSQPGSFLPPVIGNENGGSMPALI